MNPWSFYAAWLELVAASAGVKSMHRQKRREEYLARELAEDIELLERHGMSLWSSSDERRHW